MHIICYKDGAGDKNISILPVFCRGRDPARISRKFQESRGRNTLVANLVAAEFS